MWVVGLALRHVAKAQSVTVWAVGGHGLIPGQQFSAGRALIKLTQEELVRAADLHVNSIRYLWNARRASPRASQVSA